MLWHQDGQQGIKWSRHFRDLRSSQHMEGNCRGPRNEFSDPLRLKMLVAIPVRYMSMCIYGMGKWWLDGWTDGRLDREIVGEWPFLPFLNSRTREGQWQELTVSLA